MASHHYTADLVDRVITRPNPLVYIKVDFTCAWLLVDLSDPEHSIIDCSDSFAKSIGYSRDWILGRNCRFLQHPDANLPPNAPRQYVDGNVVAQLKHAINARQEVQSILINYRYGGHPFLNLLTIVPVASTLALGFCLDILSRPDAITHCSDDGLYDVDYRNFDPDSSSQVPLSQQRLLKRLLSTYSSLPANAQSPEWEDVVIAESDDLILITARSGHIVYSSASAERILGWRPDQLLSSTLASICHPSDIVELMRNLATTPTGGQIDTSFRARRPAHGFVWLEAVGSASQDAESGDQSISLTCRPRVLLPLDTTALLADDGNDLLDAWVKISRSGIFLYVSASINSIIGRMPEELVGHNVHDLSAEDSPFDLESALSQAAQYRRVKCPHMIVDSRKRRLRVNLDIFPGDTTPTRGPSCFIVRVVRVRNERGEAFPETETRPFNPIAEASSPHLLGPTRALSWTAERSALVAQNKELAQEIQRMLAARRREKRRRPPPSVEGHACTFCKAKSSPEWRRGPGGPRELCNPCGIKWAKEQHHHASPVVRIGGPSSGKHA